MTPEQEKFIEDNLNLTIANIIQQADIMQQLKKLGSAEICYFLVRLKTRLESMQAFHEMLLLDGEKQTETLFLEKRLRIEARKHGQEMYREFKKEFG